MRYVLSLLPRLWANWITLTGSVLSTVSGVAILILVGVEFASQGANVYASSFMILILPFVFAAGLLLIPIGLYVDRRSHRPKEGGATRPPDPIQAAFSTAIADRSARYRILFVMVFSVLNVILFSFAGHKAVTYMDSPKFCGTTCHTVMQPEWEAYNRSPHSRVACVQCHIGPGASWAVRAKINGLHQVAAVLTNSYHTPVPTPVEHLRPTRDTCEQCHWPQKFVGSQLRLFPHFKDDEKNTPLYNALLVHVGGEDPRTHKYQGIHWHVSADHQVRYQFLNRERTKIGRITVLENDKVVRQYDPPAKLQGTSLGEREMDCVDCHNRPTHISDVTPKNAVDKALYSGALDLQVPFMAQVAVELLGRPDVPREKAEDYFRATLPAEYAKSHPTVKLEQAALDKAAATLAGIYRRNVYPEMKVGWNTYRSNLGHQGEGDNPGCFRCHDKEHEAKLPDGTKKTMDQDCDSCHERLAFEEDPKNFDETLKTLLPKSE